jgi:hypothetical protein
MMVVQRQPRIRPLIESIRLQIPPLHLDYGPLQRAFFAIDRIVKDIDARSTGNGRPTNETAFNIHHLVATH